MTLTNTLTPPVSAGLESTAFSSEVDTVNAARWSEIMAEFGDANLYQTWPYGIVRSGEARVSRLLLKRGSTVLAAVQARIAKIPGLPLGVAYIHWGPLWRRRKEPADMEVFRQVIRAIRAEYVVRRGLIARLVPNLYESSNPAFREILETEGYTFQNRVSRRRTIVMNLEPTLDELHRGLHQKWRYHLNKARKQNLKIIEGEEDHLFEAFRKIFGEMVDRKQLVNFTGPDHCRQAQAALLSREKVRVFLCKIEGEVCAGGIGSALGDTGIYLFGATSNRGIKCYASYLTHWRMLEWVKERGCRQYDLNGINPEKNPGGFQFKTQLAGTQGRDETLLGQYDACPNVAVKWMLALGERFRTTLKKGRG
jgi:Acetyltransferase (GNAT) domain